jgi:hypothetical protein
MSYQDISYFKFLCAIFPGLKISITQISIVVNLDEALQFRMAFIAAAANVNRRNKF